MGVRAAQKGLATLCIGSDWRRLLRSDSCLSTRENQFTLSSKQQSLA